MGIFTINKFVSVRQMTEVKCAKLKNKSTCYIVNRQAMRIFIVQNFPDLPRY